MLIRRTSRSSAGLSKFWRITRCFPSKNALNIFVTTYSSLIEKDKKTTKSTTVGVDELLLELKDKLTSGIPDLQTTIQTILLLGWADQKLKLIMGSFKKGNWEWETVKGQFRTGLVQSG